MDDLNITEVSILEGGCEVQVALQTCADAAGGLREVHFVLFGAEAFQAFCAAADARTPPAHGAAG